MADTITTKDPSKEERLHGLLSGIKNIMDDHTFSNHTRLIGYREFGRERVGEYMSELKKIINKKNDFFLSFIKTVYCDPSYPENIKISSLDGRFCKVVVNEQWKIVSFERSMLVIAKLMFMYMKEFDDAPEPFTEFMIFLYNITIQSKKETRQFYAYTKKHILPLFYHNKS
jgi:hypothetical protein